METTNKFLRNNINQAILTSQYDLRGYVHPLFGRMQGIDSKGLHFLPVNLISFSAGCGQQDDEGKDMLPTIDKEVLFYYSDKDLTCEKVINLCKKFASECDRIQTEAIQYLLKDVLEKTDQLKIQADLKQESDGYLKPLDKSSRWGMIMVSLIEAFEVKTDAPIEINTF